MELNEQRICFIGAGNMAKAIIGGLIKNGFPAAQITATSPVQIERDQLKESLGIVTLSENGQAIKNADIILLCVKPQVLQSVCEEMSSSLMEKSLIVSIAAGVELDSISNWLGGKSPIVRCMPNTPMQVLKGASGLFANELVSEQQKRVTTALFSALGVVEWLDDEAKMHAVTALSGSGPAYVFLVIEAMEAAAVKQGLAPEAARKLAAQTVAGAAEMVLNSDLAPSQLKRNVMSPGGTTEQAIHTFESLGLVSIFEQAMEAALKRSKSLAES